MLHAKCAYYTMSMSSSSSSSQRSNDGGCHSHKEMRLSSTNVTLQDTHHVTLHASLCLQKDFLIQQQQQQQQQQQHYDWQSFTIQGLSDLFDLYGTALSRLAHFLGSQTKLHSLHFLDAPLQGERVLLEHLPDTLEELTLTGWCIDEMAVECIITRCSSSSSLKRLALTHCRFLGDSTLYQLLASLSKQIESLNLSHCDLSDHDVLNVLSALKHDDDDDDDNNAGPLQHLDLSHNHCQNEQTLQFLSTWLQDHGSLKTLNLQGLWIDYSSDGLLQRSVSLAPLYKALCRNTSLRDLNLAENCLDNVDLQDLISAISQQGRLEHLNVSHNPFGEESVGALLEFLQEQERQDNSHRLETIQLDNEFLNYPSAISIEAHLQCARVERKLRGRDIPMSLWPQILSAVSDREESSHSADVVLWLLSRLQGDYGLPLVQSLVLQR